MLARRIQRQDGIFRRIVHIERRSQRLFEKFFSGGVYRDRHMTFSDTCPPKCDNRYPRRVEIIDPGDSSF
jgi:hypothetical protein